MKYLVCTSLFVILSMFSFAQVGTIKGFVYDKSNGEALPGVTVAIKSIKKGSQTDVNGFFNIPKLPVGKYVISATSLGYDLTEINAEVLEDEVISIKIVLGKKSKELKGVSISAKREEKMFDTKVGMTRITPKEMKLMPSIGGEPDIAQFLQVMPGVISTGDQGGQLYIRGGSPIQNKIMLDGMTI